MFYYLDPCISTLFPAVYNKSLKNKKRKQTFDIRWWNGHWSSK